ncbi:MAG: hypothetical protein DDT34_00211 [Firmicutes bacterium]|nr:hypothetical protein [Bacillota bacterium]
MRSTFPQRTAKDVLASALRVTKLALPARVLFLRLPRMRDLCEGLAWHFTDSLPYPKDEWTIDDRSLINVCLSHAFARAEALFDKNPHPEATTVATEFMAGLFYVAHYCQNVTVTGRRGEIWSPFVDAPLGVWALAHGPIAVDSGTIPDRPLLTTTGARLALLRKLVAGETMADLGALLTKVYDQEARG